MTKGTRGTLISVRPQLREKRLAVIAEVKTDGGEVLEAYMPDREVSAVLPRSVLLGSSRTAPLSLLETIAPILSRMSEGRAVRAWKYKDRWFFSFQQWRGVRFEEDPLPETEGPGVSPSPPAPSTPA